MSRLIVIGGGAAGFFCAVNAARVNKDLDVTILEKSNKFLSKVRISGGGRCNVTHACFDIAEMVSNYPRGSNFVKKSFHQFFTNDTIEWFQRRGVELKTEPDGRMFPVSNSSQTIIECLLREANQYNVKVLMNADVKKLERRDKLFHLELSDARKFEAEFVCVASGGYPKSAMFDWLVSTGHSIQEPVPSLFTFNTPGNPITELMGVSLPEIKIKIAGTKLQQQGPALITHWGLSGPAVLKLSAWAARELAAKNYQFTAIVNWTPPRPPRLNETNEKALPKRLAEFLHSNSPNKHHSNLTAFPLDIIGKTTFKEEFVTAGGINLTEIDPNTMMSRKIPNLYFAGEVMDVDGVTGGFNFQHAWTSAYIAATSISKILDF